MKDALIFLMAREMAHQKSVQKALYSIEPNFPPGKLPGNPRFTDVYFRTSSGEPENRGRWNKGVQWDFVPLTQQSKPVDGES